MKKELLNKVIYQIYVRNYTKKGTIKALISKLDYIKDMGVDIIYLLPIHEIGQKNKKGPLGCPYSIQDYYSIAKELGTLSDFKKLIKETHKRNMKIMMDIVFNHSSRDSVLIADHDDWYWHDKNGNLGTKVGDWSDVYDLNHDNPELEEFLTDNVKYWNELGVDGFRFDVAPLIPLSFYKLLREKIGEEPILLAESVEPGFIKYLREINAANSTDSELYQYFDLEYPYDIWHYYREYFKNPTLANKQSLETILENQYSCFPSKAMKINCLENHDQPRIASFFKDNALHNITALSFFMKGTGFIYGGQEAREKHQPSLFEKETINMKIKDENLFNLIKQLIEFKHRDFNKEILNSSFIRNDHKSVFEVVNKYPNEKIYGLFNVSNKEVCYSPKQIEDGKYLDLLSNETIEIHCNSLTFSKPLILKKI